MKYTFNATPVQASELVDVDDNQGVLEYIPGLNRCSLNKAVLFGGSLIRRVLETAPIVGDQEHVYVETIISPLHVGYHGVAPGWHIDGTPRRDSRGDWQPEGVGPLSLSEQVRRHESGISQRMHTIVLGSQVPTCFLDGPITLDLEHGEDDQLNLEIDQLVEEQEHTWKTYPARCWTTWDWWTIHRSGPAEQNGWRLLVRVIESAYPPQETNFINPQRYVYCPKTRRR